MSFSDDSIGFFLQIDDQMSPALSNAVGNYENYVSKLDQLNRKAFTKQSAILGSVTQLLADFDKLPKTAEASYSRTIAALSKKSKVIRQPIRIDMTFGSEKALGKMVSQSLERVMRKVSLRMTSVPPLRRSAYWDSSQPLKQRYKGMPQPPDLKGVFQGIPKFAKGGEVLGNKKDMDSVLAWLMPGEIVLPVDVSAKLKAVTGRKSLSKNLVSSLANIQNLAAALPGLQKAAKVGLDPNAVNTYAKGLQAMAANMETVKTSTGKMSQKMKVKMLPVLGDATEMYAKASSGLDEMRAGMTAAEKGTKTFGKTMDGIFKSAKFLSIHQMLKDTGNLTTKMFSATSDAFSKADGDKINDFVTEVNQMNQFLGMSRDELASFKVEMSKKVGSLDGAVTLSDFANAAGSLAEKGVRAKDVILSLAASTSLMAKSGDADVGSLQDIAYSLTGDYGLAADSVNSFFANMKVNAKNSNVSVSEQLSAVKKQIETLAPAMKLWSPEQTKSTIDNMARFTSAAASQFMDVSPLMDVISNGLSGTVEGAIQLQQLTGKSTEEVQRLVQSGDYESLFRGLSDQITKISSSNLSSSDQLMEMTALRDSIGMSNMNMEQFLKIGTEFPKITNNMSDLASKSVSAADAFGEIKKGAEANTTAAQRFTARLTNTIANFNLFGITGVGVMDFMKEFNPSMIYSATILGGQLASGLAGAGKLMGKMAKNTKLLDLFSGLGSRMGGLVPKTGKLGTMFSNLTSKLFSHKKELGGLAIVAEKSNVITNATTKSMSKQVNIGSSLGKMLSGVGKGFGSLIKSIGSGAGSALSSLMSGLSTGLISLGNPAVLAGIGTLALIGLTVAGTAIGLAYAAKLAAPALEVLSAGVTDVMVIMSLMSPGQIVASVAALMTTGPAFAMLGTGLVAMSAGMLIAVPSIFLFSKAMSSLNTVSNASGGGLNAIFTPIMEAFNFDGKNVKSALKGMLSVAAITAGLALSTPIVLAAVPTMLAFTTADLLIEHTPVQTQGTVAFIDKVSKGFGGIDVTKADAAVAGMDATATIITRMMGLDILLVAQRGVSMLGAVGNAADMVGSWFGASSPLDRMASMGKNVSSTVIKLTRDFSSIGNVSNLESSAKTITQVGKFMVGYTEAVTSMKSLQPSVLSMGVDKIGEIFRGGRSPMTVLSGMSSDVISNVTLIMLEFSKIKTSKFSLLDQAARTLKSISLFMASYSSLSSTLQSMTPSAMSYISDAFSYVFSGANSPADKIASSAKAMATTIPRIVTELMPLALISTSSLEGVTKRVKSSGTLLSSLVTSMSAITKAGDLADKIDDGVFTDGPLSTVSDMIPALVGFTRTTYGQMAELSLIPKKSQDAMIETVRSITLLVTTLKSLMTGIDNLSSASESVDATSLVKIKSQLEILTKLMPSVVSGASSLSVAASDLTNIKYSNGTTKAIKDLIAITNGVSTLTEATARFANVATKVGPILLDKQALRSEVMQAVSDINREVAMLEGSKGVSVPIAMDKKPIKSAESQSDILTKTTIDTLVTLRTEFKVSDDVVHEDLVQIKELLFQQLQAENTKRAPNQTRTVIARDDSSGLNMMSGGLA